MHRLVIKRELLNVERITMDKSVAGVLKNTLRNSPNIKPRRRNRKIVNKNKKKRCKNCGKGFGDGYVYSMNSGIFCEECWEVALIIQRSTMKILSRFDGISCAKVALERAGFK